MRREQKICTGMFIFVFLLVVIIFGIFSFSSLVKFYITGETAYNEWSAELGSKFETDIAATFYHKFDFVNINGAARNILNQKEMNGVVKLNNGYLLTPCPYVSDDTLQQAADRVGALKKFLDKKGVALVYAIPPYTTNKYDPQLPDGVEDYGNDNLDRLVGMLQKRGVAPLDFREMMQDDGVDSYDMVYRTDHHWNTEGGFYAYTKLAGRINSLLGCRTDPKTKDLSNYEVTNYKGWHLGSRGQRTGVYFSGSDDFHLITPKFETSIAHGGVEGTFESLLINRTALENRDYTSRYTYDTTLGNSLSDYTNNMSLNDKKLLVLSDSFGKAVNPFLIISYAELRYAAGTGLTSEYIETYQPDVVVMFYYVNNAISPNTYNYVLPEEREV